MPTSNRQCTFVLAAFGLSYAWSLKLFELPSPEACSGQLCQFGYFSSLSGNATSVVVSAPAASAGKGAYLFEGSTATGVYQQTGYWMGNASSPVPTIAAVSFDGTVLVIGNDSALMVLERTREGPGYAFKPAAEFPCVRSDCPWQSLAMSGDGVLRARIAVWGAQHGLLLWTRESREAKWADAERLTTPAGWTCASVALSFMGRVLAFGVPRPGWEQPAEGLVRAYVRQAESSWVIGFDAVTFPPVNPDISDPFWGTVMAVADDGTIVTAGTSAVYVWQFNWDTQMYNNDTLVYAGVCEHNNGPANPAISPDAGTLVVSCPADFNGNGSAWVWRYDWSAGQYDINFGPITTPVVLGQFGSMAGAVTVTAPPESVVVAVYGAPNASSANEPGAGAAFLAVLDASLLADCTKRPHCQECTSAFSDIAALCEWCLESNSCTFAGDASCRDFVSDLAFCPGVPYPPSPVCSSYSDCTSCVTGGVSNATCEFCLDTNSCTFLGDPTCVNVIEDPAYCPTVE